MTTFLSTVGVQIFDIICEFCIPALGGEEPMLFRNKIIRSFTPGEVTREGEEELTTEQIDEDLSVLSNAEKLYPQQICIKSSPPTHDGATPEWLAHVDEVVFTEDGTEEGLATLDAAVAITIAHLPYLTGLTIPPSLPRTSLEQLLVAYAPRPVHDFGEETLEGGLTYLLIWAELLFSGYDNQGNPTRFTELPSSMEELKIVATKMTEKVVAGITRHYLEECRAKYPKLSLSFVLPTNPEKFIDGTRRELQRATGEETFLFTADSRGSCHEVIRVQD